MTRRISPAISLAFIVGLGPTLVSAITRAGATPEPERIQWQPTMVVQLQAADLDRSIEFYTKILGFELESRNDAINWARINVGIPGVTIGLGAAPDPKGSGTTSFNIGVGNIGSARALLESRGVTFLGPTVLIPGVVQLADFTDPDGNKIRMAAHPNGYGSKE